MGQQDLRDSLHVYPNTRVAKNIIIFVGDGMGVPTVMASRLYQGQKEGRTGEDSMLSFEKFPYTALSKVYEISETKKISFFIKKKLTLSVLFFFFLFSV